MEFWRIFYYKGFESGAKLGGKISDIYITPMIDTRHVVLEQTHLFDGFEDPYSCL